MNINLNGCDIYYETFGNESGEPIFFIHGGPGLGDCRSDIKSFGELSDDYYLVFLDMRGSGRSEDKPPYTHEQWTADIDALRDHLGYDQINILGGSYGGFLTLEYVVRYPSRVKRVLLRDTAPSNQYNDLSKEKALSSNLPGINEDMIDRLFGGQVRSNDEFKDMYRAILPLYTVEEQSDDVIEEKVNNIHFHYETHNYAFSHNKKNYDVTEQLKDIDVPVLITVGVHDWITPVQCSDDIAANVKNHTYVKFENSGHSPQVEESEKYIKVVRDFLKNN